MPHVEFPQADFKVVILGDTFTGKTSLVLRFAEGHYRDSARNPTVGAFFITKRLTVNVSPQQQQQSQQQHRPTSTTTDTASDDDDNNDSTTNSNASSTHPVTAKLQIWDTAGQEQFKKLAPMYYKNAAAAIICYDVTSPTSFETLEFWMNELQQNVPPENNLVIAMCATKCDLAPNPDTSQAEALADATGSIFMMTSAKTNANVSPLFQRISERALQIKLYGGTSSNNNNQTTSPLSFEDNSNGVNGGPEDAYGKAPWSSGPRSNINSPSDGGHPSTTGTDNHKQEPTTMMTTTTTTSGKSKTNRRLNDSIEEGEGVVETFESGESNDTHYSRCGGLMACDVAGSSTSEDTESSNCTIQ